VKLGVGLRVFIVLSLFIISGCYLNTSIYGLNESSRKIIAETPETDSQPTNPIEKTCVDSFVPSNTISASIVMALSIA